MRSHRRHRKISSRTIASFASTLLLTGLVVIIYGLDWRAALWGRSFNDPVPPPPDHSVYFERIETVDSQDSGSGAR